MRPNSGTDSGASRSLIGAGYHSIEVFSVRLGGFCFMRHASIPCHCFDIEHLVHSAARHMSGLTFACSCLYRRCATDTYVLRNAEKDGFAMTERGTQLQAIVGFALPSLLLTFSGPGE